MPPKKPPLQADPAAVAKGLKDGYDWFEANFGQALASPQDLDLPASTTVTHTPISKTIDEDQDEDADLVFLTDLIEADRLDAATGDSEDIDVIRVKEGEFEDVDVIGVKDISTFDFEAKIKALNHDAVQWLDQAETTEEGRQMAKKAYPTVCRLMANHPAFDINEDGMLVKTTAFHSSFPEALLLIDHRRSLQLYEHLHAVAFSLNPKLGRAYSNLDPNTYLTSTTLLDCGIEAEEGPGIYTYSWAKVPKNYIGKSVHPRKRLDEHRRGAASTGVNRYVRYAKETWPVATWKTAVILVFPPDCPQGILSAMETSVIAVHGSTLPPSPAQLNIVDRLRLVRSPMSDVQLAQLCQLVAENQAPPVPLSDKETWYKSFEKLNGINVKPIHLLRLMRMPTDLAFDRTNWKISGGLLEEKVRFHRMLVSKGLSKAIYPRRIAQGMQYEQYERKGKTSTDTNKYPLAGVRLFVGDQPPLDVSWEDQPEEEDRADYIRISRSRINSAWHACHAPCAKGRSPAPKTCSRGLGRGGRRCGKASERVTLCAAAHSVLLFVVAEHSTDLDDHFHVLPLFDRRTLVFQDPQATWPRFGLLGLRHQTADHLYHIIIRLNVPIQDRYTGSGRGLRPTISTKKIELHSTAIIGPFESLTVLSRVSSIPAFDLLARLRMSRTPGSKAMWAISGQQIAWAAQRARRLNNLMKNVNRVFMRLTKGYQTPAKSSTIGKMPPKSKAKVIEDLKKLSEHCEAHRNKAANCSEFSSTGEPDLPEAVALLCVMKSSGTDYVHGTRRPNIHYKFNEGDYDNMEELNTAARSRVIERIENVFGPHGYNIPMPAVRYCIHHGPHNSIHQLARACMMLEMTHEPSSETAYATCKDDFLDPSLDDSEAGEQKKPASATGTTVFSEDQVNTGCATLRRICGYFGMSSIQFGRYILVGNRDQYKDHIKGASTYAILYDIGLLPRDDASAACLAPNALVTAVATKFLRDEVVRLAFDLAAADFLGQYRSSVRDPIGNPTHYHALRNAIMASKGYDSWADFITDARRDQYIVQSQQQDIFSRTFRDLPDILHSYGEFNSAMSRFIQKACRLPPLTLQYSTLDMEIVDRYWLGGYSAAHALWRLSILTGKQEIRMQQFLVYYAKRWTFGADGRRVIDNRVQAKQQVGISPYQGSLVCY
ncbi:hypothetical protein HD553DRAFT_323348 [Filobasidium floriforme]|uniref:uncharacterized protein n=1 Tax=Filobasidium floriforme TaxID=5210 RepID=UPI001E8D037A|nr:uncharacterized protein HD553DRAFT_323348 [Filobasidium floriforme]KAH8086364.1 hypothetical protein HD553DRAFT_323348 [Filobasidium floriforme]